MDGAGYLITSAFLSRWYRANPGIEKKAGCETSGPFTIEFEIV